MYRLPVAALWILVFAAVLGHFPGLAFDYGGADFRQLAVGAGLSDAPGFTPRAWTDLWSWNLWWRLSGSDASLPHTVALLIVGLTAVLIAVSGARIGMSRAGAILAGVLWLLGPATGLAVASTTAAAELWALFFALGALFLWLGDAARRDPPLAVLLLILSLASGGIALALPPVLWLAGRWFGSKDEPVAVRRGRGVLLSIAGLLCVLSWAALRDATATPALAGGGTDLLRLLGSAAWLWPVPGPAVALRATGIAVLVGIVLALFLTRRKPAPRLRFAFAWTAAALLPPLLLPRLTTGTSALAVSVGLAWAMGALCGGPIESALAAARERVRIAGGLALLAVLLVVGPGWGFVRSSALGRQGADGRLLEAPLREAVVAAEVRRQIEMVLSTPTAPADLAILQATRQQIPDDLHVPEGRTVIFASGIHRAVGGDAGPRLMVAGRARVRWCTLLDEVPDHAFVFLDSGDLRLHPLGPVGNARIYAALIAVAAGQFELARHDLWSAIEIQGSEVRFAFDPEHLPITPAELDAEAANFARELQEDASPPALRVLKLFASVYESVRGKELVREGFGEPLRSGRVDR